MDSYTVRVVNKMLGKAHFVGTFDTQDAAHAYAETQAKRSRTFCYFEIWKGTPRRPLGPTSWPALQGTC